MLTGFQLVKKFPAFYGTRRFIAAFKSARHLSLSPKRLKTRKNNLESHIGISCFFMNSTVRCSWLKTRAFLLLIKEQIELQQVFTFSFFLSSVLHHSAVNALHFSINVMDYSAMAINQILTSFTVPFNTLKQR
jgi:hypothetical protein